jgi:hypothetical protein
MSSNAGSEAGILRPVRPSGGGSGWRAERRIGRDSSDGGHEPAEPLNKLET